MENLTINFQGKLYKLTTLASYKHISSRTLYKRYQSGERGENLVRPEVPNVKPMKVYGKRYTLPELAHAFGLSVDTVARNYRAGKRGKGLIRTKSRNGLRIPINGRKYTLSELQGISGITKATLKSRYQKGFRGKELFQPRISSRTGKAAIQTQIDGNQYTLREIGQKYHISPETLRSRYRYGDRGDDLVRPLHTQSSAHEHHHDININGKDYQLSQISQKFHVPIDTIISRYHRGEQGKDITRPKGKHRPRKRKK